MLSHSTSVPEHRPSGGRQGPPDVGYARTGQGSAGNRPTTRTVADEFVRLVRGAEVTDLAADRAPDHVGPRPTSS